MLKDDGDIIRGLGFVALYGAYTEEAIENLLRMLHPVRPYTEKEQRWPISRQIRHAIEIVAEAKFESYEDVVKILETCLEAFESRNEFIHGRIYAEFDRVDNLKSGRPNTPDRKVKSAELYELANWFGGLSGEVLRPMLFKIPRFLAEYKGHQ
jgi:hypothetical protein